MYRSLGLLAMGAALAVVVLVSPALPQGNLASVTGLVTDSARAVMPGVTITIRNTDTGIARSVKSNQVGMFTITSLPVGPYELTATADGFRTFRKTGIVLAVNQVLRADIVMSVGQVNESVTVTTSVVQLETERGAIRGDVVIQDEIQELPLEGRDFTDLALFVPGVLPKAEGGQGSALNVNGARATNTNFYVDGFNNRNSAGAAAQVRPNIDALQEFKMEVSGFSAEYGKYAGGILNMALASGTNRVHGSVFWTGRNNIIDARSFFDTEKQKLNRHQFGVTLGGPIIKNKTFYLVSYEGYTQVLGQTRLSQVPTELERQGDFSQSRDYLGKPVYLKDPWAKKACTAKNQAGCFPGNVIPKSRLDQIGLNLISWYPLPNRQGIPNYLTSANDTDKWNSYLGKLDHRFSDKDNIGVRYQMRMVDNENPFAGNDLGIFGWKQSDDRSLFGLDWNHLFSPTVILEVRGGYSRNSTHQNGNWQGVDVAAELGLPSLVSEPEIQDWPRVQPLSPYSNLGTQNSQPQDWASTDIQGSAKLTWVKGTHTVKSGFDVSRVRLNRPYFNQIRGQYNFNSRWTGHTIGDLELGLPNNAIRQVGFVRNYWRSTTYGAFINDDWKVTRNLTLNLGLRYELNTPPVDRYNVLSNFVPGPNQLAISAAFPGLEERMEVAGMQGKVVLGSELGLPRALVHTDYTNFAPRLGFAWRTFGSNNTVIRGGYGIFYGGEILNPLRNQLANNFPFTLIENHSRLASNPDLVTLENPFPESRFTLTGVTNGFGYQVDAPTAYLQTWNLTVERELREETVLELGYVGSKGTHLGRRYDINQPERTLDNYIAGTGFPRPIDGFNTINYFGFGTNSIYNAFVASLRRRSRGGFFYRVNYTYSKSLDEASQFTGNSNGGFPNALDSNNLWLDRGRSDFDIGHVFTGVFSWELPVGKNRRFNLEGPANAMLGGWQLSGTSRIYTGAPLTVRTADTELNQGESLRPNRIASGQVDPDPTLGKKGVDYPWFDLRAFEEVPCVDPELAASCTVSQYGFTPFQFGNSGRNILDGPGKMVIDLGIRKNIRFKERQSLQIRFDVFNVLNRTNFLLPDNFFNSITGGVITQVGASGREGGPRVFQAGLRYRF
jgi:hypothetical protein